MKKLLEYLMSIIGLFIIVIILTYLSMLLINRFLPKDKSGRLYNVEIVNNNEARLINKVDTIIIKSNRKLNLENGDEVEIKY